MKNWISFKDEVVGKVRVGVHRNSRRSRIFCLIALIGYLASSPPAISAEAKEKPTSVTVDNHGWTENGDLVLAVTVQAGSKKVSLGHAGAEEKDATQAVAFSLVDSFLIDAHSQAKLSPRPRLPKKPFFGTMRLVLALDPGDSITLGVAFPRPPEPPRGENGLPEDYKFTLTIPGQGSTEFTIPYKKP
jgi:hypothetical protein